MQRDPQVIDRRRRRSEVVDEVDRLLDEVGLDDVEVQVDEVIAAQVGDVVERSGLQVVHADDPVALCQERITEMGAKEAGTAGNQ